MSEAAKTLLLHVADVPQSWPDDNERTLFKFVENAVNENKPTVLSAVTGVSPPNGETLTVISMYGKYLTHGRRCISLYWDLGNLLTVDFAVEYAGVRLVFPAVD